MELDPLTGNLVAQHFMYYRSFVQHLCLFHSI